MKAIPILVAAAACLMAAVPASAGNSKTAKLYPFHDLPGVKVPEDPLKAKLACHTELRQDRRGETAKGYAYRVYVCRNGHATFESTTVPLENNWKAVNGDL